MAPQREDARDERLDELFESALATPEPEREAWIRNQCGQDTQLADEVLRSLRLEERMKGFLAEPLVPRPLPEPELAEGIRLGEHLRIIRRIAEGGMAAVYEAVDARLGPVAVKVPRDAFREKLIAEARHSLRVTHPNICRVHTVDTARVGDRTINYLSMELLHGETLQQRITRDGTLPLSELLSVAEQLARGLDEAHRNGVA